MRMLESEGFRYEGYVDIFDAGPTVECDVDDVDAVARSRVFKVEISGAASSANVMTYLVANTSIDNYRAALVAATPPGESFTLSAEVAGDLNVSAGDDIRVVPLLVSDRH